MRFAARRPVTDYCGYTKKQKRTHPDFPVNYVRKTRGGWDVFRKRKEGKDKERQRDREAQ